MQIHKKIIEKCVTFLSKKTITVEVTIFEHNKQWKKVEKNLIQVSSVG